METGITAKLAEHTSKLRYEDIPSDVIEKAKDCILDQIGVELIGSTLEWKGNGGFYGCSPIKPTSMSY